MAVKAKGQISLTVVVDVKGTYRYYLLQSSTLSKPSKPTVYPPSSWSDTEPTYTEGSTSTLYFVDCTVFCDDTFSYSDVSVSSSYEAAKTAYNKALNAISSANNATNVANNAYNKITSRGEQLVVNGNGMLGNNTNFSGLVFDGANSCDSPGSFTKTKGTGRTTIISDEYFPVSTNGNYTFSLDAKSLLGTGTIYTFLDFYDVDKNSIKAINHLHNSASTTTLAKDLKSGDTVIYLTSSSGWSTSYSYGFYMSVWNYKNSFGYTYPAETYTRNRVTLPKTSANKLDGTYLNTTAHTITLTTAYSGATIPAGTAVSQGSDGANFKYMPLSNVKLPTEWTHYSATISGVDYSGTNVSTKFPPGVAYAKVGFLWNYNNASGEQQWITNIVVTDSTAADAAMEAAKAAKSAAETAQSTADGKNTVFYQASQPSTSGRKTNDIWFDTDDGNKMYYYTGSAWSARQFGQNSIAANAIVASHITSEAITAGKIAAGAVTANKIAALAITADHIAANTITTGKIASGAITAALIASSAITTDKLAAGAITGEKIYGGTITGDKLVANTITAAQIASATITTTQIAANTITGSNIAASTITGAKIAGQTITGSNIAAATISADKLTIASGGNLYTRGYDTFENIQNVASRIYFSKNANVSASIVEDGSAYYGSRCLKMTASGSDGYLYLGDSANGYGCIPVIAGQTYIISAYMKGSASFNAQIYACGRTSISSSTGQHTGATFTVDTTWRRYYLRYTASSSYPYLALRIDNDGGSGTTLWVDAIQIEKGTTAQEPSEFSPASTTVIDGSNIVTGSIKAAQIDVANLFAQQITSTGSITGVSFHSTGTDDASFPSVMSASGGLINITSYEGLLDDGTYRYTFQTYLSGHHSYMKYTELDSVTNMLYMQGSQIELTTNPASGDSTVIFRAIVANKQVTAYNLKVPNLFNVTGIEQFHTQYVKKMLGTLSAGTAYASLSSTYKDGTYHRMWRLRFPSGKNFWGKIKVTLWGTYSSFNASGIMSKSITCNFNSGTIYNNVGSYDGLGVNVEQDFRISEAIWNSSASAWEILIWQKNLSGNNSPQVMIEAWAGSETHLATVKNITAQTVELVQDTTYTALKATSTGGTKTVTWANTPVFESPTGVEVSLSGHTHSYLPLSGGKMTGPIAFTDNAALPSKTLQYVCGIDGFADGGQMGWQSKSAFLSGYLTSSSAASTYATKQNGIYYIEGTGSTAGTWLGAHDEISAYYEGLVVAYKIPVAGASTTTLNINSLGAVNVVRNVTTAVSTAYAVQAVVILIYTVDTSGTAYWKVADYDANTSMRVYRQTSGYNADYPLLVSRTKAADIATAGTNGSNEGVYGVMWNDTTIVPTLNPSTGLLKIAGLNITKNHLTFDTGTTQSATKGIKWSAINSKNPYIGYATDQVDGTFVVASLGGTTYATGLAIGGGSGNLLYKGQVVLNASNYSSYASPLGHTHSYLPLSGGTIAGTSGDTPLYAKSAHATASYIGFQNTGGTTLGYFGFSSANVPVAYVNGAAKTLLHAGNYTSYAAAVGHTHSNYAPLQHITKSGSGTYYIALGTMVADNSSNYGNITIKGRIGGWEQSNSANFDIMMLNRSSARDGNTITATVIGTGEVDTALTKCDIVVYKSASDTSATVYLKTSGYWLYDFDYSTYQHSITYTGTTSTTTPSGTLIWSLSTAPKLSLNTSGTVSHTPSAMTVRGSTSGIALTASDLALVSLPTAMYSSGSDCSASGGGIKCAKAGTVLVSGAVYFTEYVTEKRGVYIKKNTTELCSQFLHNQYGAGSMSAGTIVTTVAAGDVIYLYARCSVDTKYSTNTTSTYLSVTYL